MSADAPPTPRQVAEAVLLDENQRRRLFAYAGSRFGISREDSEDILQDTALELLRCRSSVRSPEGFVFAIFRARCARFTVPQGVARRAESRVEEREDCAAESLTPERLECRVALNEALGEVSSACRRLLAAYYVEGQSLREAARTLSLTYSSVAKTINRCLKRLRRCLA